MGILGGHDGASLLELHVPVLGATSRDGTGRREWLLQALKK